MSNILDAIIDAYSEEEFLIADGFDDAIIGIDTQSLRIVYSVTKCIETLKERDGMGEEEAIEFFEYNTLRGNDYMGEGRPIFMEDYFG